ncbi:PRC-barrel domain-containing protein [Wenzhouxiangella sp. XN24]|uniref:PRC-barrel domain-containing protein n=1 Tax=Wenzhouxiangella sp. XN24 TaxID=2713569 RepID=UPI0013EA1B92|nr:PRC-barrel domain-containing protein [Wenzhouxiangella sp. XN24]NGX16486.1 PRC-barrel domain containing protein [Wenzhouxiangella sp. XN24]
MKHLVTISALALTLPAIGIAQAGDDARYDKDKSKQQTQQSRMQQQDRTHARNPEHMQQRQGESDQAHMQRMQQMGQRTSQNRLTRMEQSHIKLEDLEDTTIVNRQDEEVGTISDVILDQQGRVAAVVVTTGGVMGIGGETKALAWDDVKVRTKSDEDDEYKVVVNMSEQELENLPEFEAERRTGDKDRDR